MLSADFWIEKLQLQPHPEGGYFREVYRSSEVITNLPQHYQGNRCFGTYIYYLLRSGDFSTFHRILSDEIWHFHVGGTVNKYVLAPDGELSTVTLGIESGQLHSVAPKHHWFAAEVTEPDSYVLLGCTVMPGFEFADFEMANRDQLLTEYPQHAELIERLTYPAENTVA